MRARSCCPTLKVIPPVPQAGRLWSAAVIVSTINVNGIRAATKQRSSENLGLLPWLAQTDGRRGVPAGDPCRRRAARRLRLRPR